MAMTHITLRMPDGRTLGRVVDAVPRKGDIVRIVDDRMKVIEVEFIILPKFQDGYYGVNIWLESA
jgi:hypothetical protein